VGPQEPAARARPRLLELKSDEVYFPHIIRLMGLQDAPEDPAAIAARAGAAAYYADIETLLADGRPWLAGTQYTYADIAFYMAQLFGERMGAPIPGAAGRLIAWRERMDARPAVRQVAGAMGRYLLSQNRRLPAFLQALT
jgi:glutathione S-transferase